MIRRRTLSVSATTRAPGPDGVDWDSLSPEGRWILQNIAEPVAYGRRYGDLAADLGVPKQQIGKAMRQLRDEIRAQVD